MSERRKASPPELAAGVLLLVAALVLTGSVLLQRLRTRAPSSSSTGTIIVPDVAQEGVSYASGPNLLFIDSTPEGAEATLDEQVLGVTPYSSNLSCRNESKARLVVKKAGYQPMTFELDCGRGTTRVSATLKRGNKP